MDELNKNGYIIFKNSIQNNDIPNDIIIYKLEEYTSESDSGQFFQFENFNLKSYNHSEYFDTPCRSGNKVI